MTVRKAAHEGMMYAFLAGSAVAAVLIAKATASLFVHLGSLALG